MATGSPAKPWERNRSTTNSTGTSALRTNGNITSTDLSSPTLPSRNSLNSLSNTGPYSNYASNSMYGNSSLYGGSRYGGAYGNSMYGNSMYGGGAYGSSMYGSRYGSGAYGSSMYGSSMYGGGAYGGMYGSRYGSGSLYGGNSYGYGSTYSRYGSGYDDASYRNPYPRGKYWSYGAEDEFGNPIDPQDNGSILMDMENVVEGFGHFTRILDYNFETIHCSFASILRLFDSMGELRRTVYYGLQGLAVFALLGKLFRYLQKTLYQLIGKPIPEYLTSNSNSSSTLKGSMDSLEDQWNGNVTQKGKRFRSKL